MGHEGTDWEPGNRKYPAHECASERRKARGTLTLQQRGALVRSRTYALTGAGAVMYQQVDNRYRESGRCHGGAEGRRPQDDRLALVVHRVCDRRFDRPPDDLPAIPLLPLRPQKIVAD